jgi:hypothetical protein
MESISYREPVTCDNCNKVDCANFNGGDACADCLDGSEYISPDAYEVNEDR